MKNLFYICFCVLGLFSCASSGSLDGGPKDETPPMVLQEKSTANFQTMFFNKSFLLVFDEFIVIKDPIKQIVVSPPLSYIPQTKVRGKSLTFTFNEKEVIRDSTTYTVNFGEAIQDLHENNKLLNYRFVFSTGTIIDSLSLKGRVFDGASRKPAPSATVLLYDNLLDSAFVKEKPFYFARTDKEGNFKIENIKNDTFRIFAITDENVSYTFNEGAESLAYRDSLITLMDMDTSKSIDLTLSMPPISLRVFDTKSKVYGKSTIQFNRNIEEGLSYALSRPDLTVFTQFSGDSLNLWYKGDIATSDSFELFLSFDTLLIKVPEQRLLPSDLSLRLLSGGGTHYGLDTIHIAFNVPVVEYMTDSIMLLDTAGKQVEKNIFQSSPFSFKIITAPLPSGAYRLKVLRGAFKDYIGRGNVDSLNTQFQIPSDEKTSGLSINLQGLDSMSQYIISLLDGNKTVNLSILRDVKEKALSFGKLRPNEYKLQVIEDFNRNGRWDSVNFWERRQAEPIRVFTLEKLRENWTIEADINLLEEK